MGLWFLLRDALWFIGFMSLLAPCVIHMGGWFAEAPVENELDCEQVLTEPAPIPRARRPFHPCLTSLT
jgi:hypothetical protein